MGLFDFRKKKAAEPEQKPEYEAKPTDKIGVNTTVNLSEKAVLLNEAGEGDL